MIDNKLFGTNGVRGIANKTMTAETSLKLGSSLGTYLHNQHNDALDMVAAVRPSPVISTHEVCSAETTRNWRNALDMVAAARPVISTHEVCRHHDASGVVAVARDTRISGRMLKSAAVSGVLSAGCSVVDVGIVLAS